jgi:hypothetical protein
VSGVRYHERLFVAGPSESGKTELLNLFFSEMECQRLLYDSKGHEFQISEVEPVFDPAEIDWRDPIIHYVTTSTEAAEADEVFSQAEQQRDLWVCVHELGDLCEYETNKTPGSVNRYLAQGGAKGRGFGGASQEPVDMPKRAKKEINHAYTMAPPMSREHLQVVAGIVHGTNAAEMAEAIEDVYREHGPHSFIYYPRGAMREPEAFPPIPEAMRQRIIVERREVHPRERSG